MQQEGIEYIGMRNEQAACYAAQVRDFYRMEKLAMTEKLAHYPANTSGKYS